MGQSAISQIQGRILQEKQLSDNFNVSFLSDGLLLDPGIKKCIMDFSQSALGPISKKL